MYARSALIAVLLTLALSPASAGAAARYPELPVVAAQPARAFGDSVGVNVRLTHLDTSYGDFATLQARLRELGVRYVSDSICATCEYQIDRLRRLAAVGIRADLGVGSLSAGTASIGPALQALRTRVRGSVISIRGVNEPDISGDPQWIEHTRAFQAELYRRVKADPSLAALPVIGPSLVNRESRAALGDLSGFLDRGNLHPYAGGRPPLYNLEDERQLAALVSGAKPLVATEMGYHTHMAFTGLHRPASERAVATYTARTALEAFRGGIERTYLYQLADYWSAQEALARGLSPSENSFGLLRWNLSPKPSFLALRNLLRAAGADSAPVSSPGGLRFALEGAGPDVRRLLVRSADGSYALVLWRTVSVWDRDAQRDLSPAADRVDVVLGEPVALARRFEPVSSSAEAQRWNDPQRIPVDLAGNPIVLKLGVAAAATAPAPGLAPRVRDRLRDSRRRGRARRCSSARPRVRRSRARAVAIWWRPCVKQRRSKRNRR